MYYYSHQKENQRRVLKNYLDVQCSMLFRFPFYKCTLTGHISTLDGSEGAI